MPYSDNLYSVWGGDGESDAEDTTSQNGPNHRREGSQRVTSDGGGGRLPDVRVGADGGSNHADDVDALSPTDGYFGSAAHAATSPTIAQLPLRVPNIWVRDPSLDQQATDKKAPQGDAALSNSPGDLERRSNYAYHQPSSSIYSNTPYSPTTVHAHSYTPQRPQRIAYDEHSVFFPREAPPAYTPSPTSTSLSPTNASSVGDTIRSYNTFASHTRPVASMGRPGYTDDTQGLLAREPQSMGSPDDSASSWNERARRQLRQRNLSGGKLALVALVLTFLTFGFLTAAIPSGDEHPSGLPKRPVNKVPMDGDPNMEYPDLENDYRWGQDVGCRNQQETHETKRFQFTLSSERDLDIVQNISHVHSPHTVSGASPVTVRGVVAFQAIDDHDPEIVIDIITSSDRIEVQTSWDSGPQRLVVTTPDHIDDWDLSYRPCVNIMVTVWVPGNADLRRLSVEATQLNIVLLENLSLEVGERSRLSSVSGSIVGASRGSKADDDATSKQGSSSPNTFGFRSPVTGLSTTSGPVTGLWPLYQDLLIQSISGGVVTYVEPRESLHGSETPATLRIETTSGDLALREPAEYDLFPSRDYRLNVQSSSGNILVEAGFTSYASVESISGRIRADLLPIFDASWAGDDTERSSLRTGTTSGNSYITVESPLWLGGDGAITTASALRCLASKHGSISGRIELTYPTIWEGRIRLETLSGKRDVRGPGVEVISGSDKGWPRKPLVAKKGEGSQWVRGETTSGAIVMVVADDDATRSSA